MFNFIKKLGILSACFSMQIAHAAISVPLKSVSPDGVSGKEIGTVTFEANACGILITPNLHGLTPGIHGFHIHEKAACADNGMAAGGHLDPHETKKHHGPYKTDSHLGDLPVLIVDSNGNATLPTFAPRLSLAEIKNRAVMVHVGGDNYSDNPAMGGGGARFACGVIQK